MKGKTDMKLFKPALLAVLLSISFVPGEIFANEIQAWIKSVQWIDNDERVVSKSEIDTYLEKGESLIKRNIDDPTFWYFLGRLNFLKAGELQRGFLKDGKPYQYNNQEYQGLIKDFQLSYKKALDIDESSNALAHLDSRILVSMAQNVLSPPDIKKRAARKALNMSIAGSRPPFGGEVASYEWYMYELLLGAYADAGDNQLYLETIDEMMERYPNSRTEELQRLKQDAEAHIALQAHEADAHAQTESYAENTKAEPVAEPYAAPKAVEEKPKAEAAKSEESKQPESKQVSEVVEKDNSLTLLLAGGAVILVGLIGWLALSRKRIRK